MLGKADAVDADSAKRRLRVCVSHEALALTLPAPPEEHWLARANEVALMFSLQGQAQVERSCG